MVERGEGRQGSGVPDKTAPHRSPNSPSRPCSLLLGGDTAKVTVRATPSSGDVSPSYRFRSFNRSDPGGVATGAAPDARTRLDSERRT